MKTIAEIEKEGFAGPDVDLETSLMEYGMAWKDDGDEGYKFYYGIGIRENMETGEAEYYKFDYGWIGKDINPKDEWDWINWDEFARAMGCNIDEYMTNDIPAIVFDLASYYGVEEIFGTSYSGGFEIACISHIDEP